MVSIKSKIKQFGSRIASLKESRPWARILFNKYAVVTILFVVWMLFIDNNNMGVWYRTVRQLNAQEKQIEYFRKEIAVTEDRIDHLRSDRDSLERFAREQYGFHERGEDVYIVIE